MDSSKIAKIAYKALEEKKGEDIKILEIKGISILADYFIIASAGNSSQFQAMIDSVEEELHKEGCNVKHLEGNKNSSWVLMDCGDLVVHIFNQEDRLFYDLERMWSDGKQVAPEEL